MSLSRYAAPVSVTRMTFDDEFNMFSNSPDGSPGTWMTTFPYTGEAQRTLPANYEAEYYSDSSVGENPFTLTNGVLNISATPAAAGSNPYGLPYDSGLITTYRSFSQLYGYFEVRAELPSGTGLWPAFWLVPASNQYTAELDVFESIGADATHIYSSVHGSTAGTWQNITRSFAVPNTSTGFHTYGVDWEPTTTTFYVDGKATGSEPTPSSMNQPMYLLLNVAVGGNGSWPGAPDAQTTFPAAMHVDYVRAFATSNTSSVGGSASIPVAASQDDTIISATQGGSIVDASGNAWTIANGQVLTNGVADTATSNVTELAYVRGTVWEENSAAMWRGKALPTDAWSPSSGTARPPISISVTNVTTGTISTIDATKTQAVAQSGSTFRLTAPGVASVTVGSTKTTIAFVAMTSVAVTAGTAASTITLDGGSGIFTAGRAAMDITGGPGINTYVFHRGNANVVIEDFSSADVLTVDTGLKASSKIASDGQGGSLLSFGSAAGTVDLKGVAGFSNARIQWA